MVIDTIWLWVLFNLFVVAMLALDLGVFHKGNHVISMREAVIWSIIWTLIQRRRIPVREYSKRI
jgi:tellurite resistance protein TerC